MDDPWANAWQEPAKPPTDSRNAWSRPEDAETDIAIPSWAAGTDVKWAEPSNAQESLWNAELPVTEWNPSPYDTIHLGNTPQTERIQPDPSASPITGKELSSPFSSPALNLQSLGPPSLPDDEELSMARSSSPTPHSHSSTPGSPDAFGTFETGVDVPEVGVDPWGHSAELFAPASGETDAWVSNWAGDKPIAEVEADSKPVDEWEAAKQRQERQDRQVPPEVLSSILRQFQGLANDLWPKVAENNDTSITQFPHGRQSTVEGIEGIMEVVDRLIPQDLTLPQHVQFSKTFTSKHMNEALRLTRHTEITRSSPMALYMASKGSTAWETSVKSRPEVLKDDLLPQGWRIIEKEEPTLTADNKKKTSGGLLSFFGRRAAAAPPEANPRLWESPVRPVGTPPPVVTNTNSPRASVDSMQSLPTGPVTSSPVRPSSTCVAASSDRPSTPPPLAPPLPSQVEVSEPVQPASAVSRFLNRFSRNKATGSIPRNSLALSSDDLEFLSDIVPSADEEQDEDIQLRGLSNMIASSPRPTKLPPPLAPPPRSSALWSPGSSSRSKSPTLKGDRLSLSSSTSRLETPHLSTTQQPPAIPLPLSFPTAPVASHSTSPLSPLVPSSFRSGSRSSSTFSSPAPSRSHTPLPSKRTPTAIMSATSSIIPSGSSLNFPSPPSSTKPLVLPPPPNVIGTPKLTPYPQPSKPLTPIPSALVKPFGLGSGDEFSDFYQPQSRALDEFNTSISSSAFSDASLMPASSSTNTSYSNDLLDDFDDFVSSPIRSPSPPRPPQKPASFGHKPNSSRQFTQLYLRSISPDKPQPPLPPPKISRATDHQRTMSLVETAAARPGRWPAPPSPLPDVIPPPGALESSSDSDYFASGSTMQNQQTNAIAGLGASVSSPASFSLTASASQPPSFLPVPSSTLSPSPVHIRAVSPPVQPKQGSMRILATPPGPATSGGLSAQDLSFFEGL